MVNIFTEKASCCCPLTTAVNVFLLLTLLLRLAGLTCGCFYGPYLYLVVSIGGLYLAGESQPGQPGQSGHFTSSRLSSHLVSQPENSGGTIPLRLLQPESLDFHLANYQHPGCHRARCRPWWVKHWSEQLQQDGLIVLRLVSRQSRTLVHALHSNPLRCVPHHLSPPPHPHLLCLPPQSTLPISVWGLHRCKSNLPLLWEVKWWNWDCVFSSCYRVGERRNTTMMTWRRNPLTSEEFQFRESSGT